MTFDWLDGLYDKPFLLGFCMYLAFWFFGLFVHLMYEAFRRGMGGGKTRLDIGE